MYGKWIDRKENWLGDKKSAEPIKKGEETKEPEGYGVEYIPLRCPRCNSKNVRCYATYVPLRYHLCRNCGHKFKSVEVDG